VAAPERCPKPVIAKLRGYAFGVGLELALACDFRIAADDLVLGLPEIKLGMIPGSGGTQRLARLIGLARAKDAIMRGRRIQAAEALTLGIVSEVVPVFHRLAEVEPAVDPRLGDLGPNIAEPVERVRGVRDRARQRPRHAVGAEVVRQRPRQRPGEARVA